MSKVAVYFVLELLLPTTYLARLPYRSRTFFPPYVSIYANNLISYVGVRLGKTRGFRVENVAMGLINIHNKFEYFPSPPEEFSYFLFNSRFPSFLSSSNGIKRKCSQLIGIPTFFFPPCVLIICLWVFSSKSIWQRWAHFRYNRMPPAILFFIFSGNT